MYKVIHAFHDICDALHYYQENDEYPRSGYEPPAERIAALLGVNNGFGAPVIAEKKKRGKKNA